MDVTTGLSSAPSLGGTVNPMWARLGLSSLVGPLDVYGSIFLCAHVDSREIDQWLLTPAIEHSFGETLFEPACSYTGVGTLVFTDIFLS